MRILTTSTGSIILVLSLLIIAKSSIAQVYVDHSATGANDGTSWANAFVDLQTALTSTAGGEIWVAAGTYRPVACNPCLETDKELAFRPQPDVRLYGGFAGTETTREQRDWNTNLTILSGDIGVQGDSLDNVFSVMIVENSTTNTVLDGFIIEEGNGDGSFPFANGGGLLLDANPGGTADMQIRNCTFRNNYAGGGGAISIDCVLGGRSRALIRDCIFEGNTASMRVVSSGAAIQMYGNAATQIEPQIINCIFRNNHSGSFGGAIAGVPTGDNSLLAPVIDSCLFENNRADSRGGALLFRMANFGSSSIEIRNSRFIGNESGSQGGAMYLDSRFDNLSDDIILNCLFRENRALGTDTLNEAEGGAAYLRGSQNGTRRQQFVNCVFDRNSAAQRGGAIASTSFSSSEGICWTDLINCTFSRNFSAGEGGAIYTYGLMGQNSFSAFNSIFWQDSAAVAGQEIRNSGAGVTFAYCDIDGGLPGGVSNGGNNVNIDPQFADPENGDLHLLGCSPLINLGSNGFLPGIAETDLDGNDRIHAGTVDLGAYEIGVIYVDHTATGANTGRSWGDAFTDVQNALAVAGAGDQIWVARGTYFPVVCNPCVQEDMETAFHLVNHVEMYGGFAGTETGIEQRNWTANPTILSGDIGILGDSLDNVYNVLIGENLSDKTILDGFIIEEGNGDGSFGFANGGGLLLDASPGGIADLIIRNCTFRNNYAGGGGAISIDCVLGGSSKAQIRDCIFEGNTASLRVISSGGAIQMYGNAGAQIEPEIVNCIFRNNYSGSLGGAIAGVPTGENTFMAPLIDSCSFENNRADSRGGALLFRMASFGLSNVVVRNSRFINNASGGQGGALYFDSRFDNIANDTMLNCLFRQNRALGTNAQNEAEGGAMFLRGSQNGKRQQQIINCVFDRNSALHRGGAIATTSFFSTAGVCSTDLINSTFYGNSTTGDGGAIHAYGQEGQNTLRITNSILWEDNAGGTSQEIFNDAATIEIAYSDVSGGLPNDLIDGGNNVDIDPQFVNIAAGDLHLPPCSPVINIGLNTALPIDLTDLDRDGDRNEPVGLDLDGQARIFEERIDLGAYEWDGSGNPIQATTTVKAESCGGQCDGEVRIIPNGGQPGYTFAWSNGEKAPLLEGLCAGTYYVTILDSGNCMLKDSVSIAAGEAFSLVVSSDTVICAGESVLLSATAGGGSGNFGFTWDNGLGTGATQTVSPESTTTYTVLASDDSDCTQETQVTVTVNPVSVPAIMGVLSFCTGTSTTLSVDEFASYLWSNGDTSAQITVNQAGIYGITVTDANGCEGTAEVTVEEAEALSPQIQGSTTFCPGSSTTLDGGADFATYLWSTGSTAPSIEVIEAANYSLTVTDASGCSGTASIAVSENDALAPTISGELSFCPGTSTTLHVGEFATYLWSTGATTAQIDVSQAGLYSVTVSDVNGCEGVAEVIVEEAAPLSAQIQGSTTFCPGSNTILDGGAGFVTYRWSTGSPEQLIEVTQAGTYNLTVTDEAGCSGTASAEVTENSTLSPTISGQLTLCAGNNTTLDAGVFATYLWSTGETTSQISVATAGQYSVTVSDSNGCEGTTEVAVLEEEAVELSIFSLAPFCPDNSAVLDGGTGFAGYEWSTGSTDQSIQVLEPGAYSLTVTTAAGCTATDAFTIDPLPAAVAGTDIFTCFDTTLLSANLPEGTTGSWSTTAAGLVIIDPEFNETVVSGLSAQATLVWTLSTGGCPNYSADSVVINRQAGPVAVDDFLQVSMDVDTAMINLIANDLFSLGDDWSVNLLTEPDLGRVDGLDNGMLFYLPPTANGGTTQLLYELCIQGCGCAEGTLTIEVEAPTLEAGPIPNAITPNGDGLNDYFIFDAITNASPEEIPDNELIIFNRWGDIIFRQENYQNDWSGTNQQGQLLPEATYYFILRLDIGQGLILKGDVTVIR
jgi:gliding motility-associated-like protein